MHSYQIINWGQPLEPRDYPDPQPEGRQVLVRVSACGVCHSDLHIWDGYFDLGDGNRITLEQRGVGLPFTLGHEIVGEVVAVGPEAEGVAVGDRRVVYPWIGCGECEICRRGDELLCVTPHTLGTRRNGGYSDHVLVPDPRYLVDFAGVSEELACIYACSGLTAYSALRKTGALTADDTLVLIGAGGVGLNGVQLAPAVTRARVVVADVNPDKRAAAEAAGAAATIDNGQPDAVRRVMEMTNGGAAAAIDFVGAPAAGRFGIDVLRKGGTLVSVGLYGGVLPVPSALLPLKMMHIVGSYVGTLQEMHELMDLVKTGRVAPIPLDLRPLDQATQALTDLREGKVLGRVVLQP